MVDLEAANLSKEWVVSLLLLKSEESEDRKPEGLREKFYLLASPRGLGAKILGDRLGESFLIACRGL